MANIKAVQSGNWSSSSTWENGISPTSADDVYANTYTVTVDVSPTVLSVRNTSGSGINTGGVFSLSNGVTLTATATTSIYTASENGCVVFSLNSPNSASLVANCQGGTSTNQTAVVVSGSGTLFVTGNIQATGGQSCGIINSGIGTVTVTGTVRGGNLATGSAFNFGINNTGNGIINVIGDVYGGTAVGFQAIYGINNNSNGTINVTGSVYAQYGSAIVSNNGILNITGLVVGGYGLTNGLYDAVVVGGSTVVTITGNLISSATRAFSSTTAITLIHSGTATAFNNVPAISSTNTGATVILSGPFITSTNGTHAVYCPNWKWQNTNPTSTYYQIRSANLSTIRPLYTADYVSSLPAASNVRSGTVYGPSSELTGTMAVPPAGSVLFGVPVDNTTGTSAASGSFWNHPISGITSTGSIGERLKNAATINTTSKQISDAFSGPYL